MTRERRFKRWLVAYVVAAMVLALLPLLLGASHLPEPLATHFGPSGAPDGALPIRALALVLVAGSVLPAALAWPRRSGQLSERAPLAFAAVSFTSGLMVVMSAVLVFHNWDKPDWRDARQLPLIALPLVIGLPAAIAFAAFKAARRFWPPAHAVPARNEALPLAAGERAYWSGSATNPWFIVLGVVLIGEGWVLNLIARDAPAVTPIVCTPVARAQSRSWAWC